MTASRYRRSLMRFVRVYRCQDCRFSFEQDTRGYQGFHFGLVASLGTPILYACIVKPAVSIAEIGLVGLVLLLLFWPVAINLGHYLKVPVMTLNIARPLLPVSSGRKIWGRILGGESRLLGLLLGAGTGFSFYLLMILALVLLALA